MDDFRIAFDGFNYSFFNIDILTGNLISFKTMDLKVDKLNFILQSFAAFFDYLKVKIVVMDWLIFLNALLMGKNISEQPVLFRLELIEKSL